MLMNIIKDIYENMKKHRIADQTSRKEKSRRDLSEEIIRRICDKMRENARDFWDSLYTVRKAAAFFLFFLPSGTAFFASFSGEEKETSIGFPLARIQRGGEGGGESGQ